jgi:hypothetical protein
MIRKHIFGLGFICAMALSLTLVACGDDDDDGSAGTPGGGAGTPAGGSGGAAGTAPSGNNTMTGYVTDYLPDTNAPDITLRFLENVNGDPLGIEVVSDADGNFTASGLPDGKVGVLALGDLDAASPRMDTYTFNIPSNDQDRQIFSFGTNLGDIVNAALGDPDLTKGGASGTILFVDASGQSYPVDCAVVELEAGEADVYYINEGGLPDTGLREHTTANGRFYMRNVAPGPVTINAVINGEVMGSVSLPIMAAQDSTDGKNVSNLTRIVLEGVTEDPTPDCVP